jgi:F-type H+-transporting ATPase subunit epsilon
MKPFPLKIVTPYGPAFEGDVEELVVRTTTGDMGFLAGHVSCVAPLGMGRATIVVDGKKRYAACIGGMVSVSSGHVTLVPTTFEWADQIDLNRAEASYQRAKQVLDNKASSNTDVKLAEARLRRALVRKSVGSVK